MTSRFAAALAATALLGLWLVPAQAGLIYNVNRTIGTGSVTGFIETDGTLGALTAGNILDFVLTLTSPNLAVGSPGLLDAGTGDFVFQTGPNAVTATASGLFFDPTVLNSKFGFDDNGAYFWCLDTSNGCVGAPGESIGAGRQNSDAEWQAHTATFAFATRHVVPESATLGLFASALAGLGLVCLTSAVRRHRTG